VRYRFGSFELDDVERKLSSSGEHIDIGGRALDVLLALVKSSHSMVSKDTLMEAAWPNTFVSENNLQVQISGIRRLIGRDTVVTVAGRGYRFTLPVETGVPPAGNPPPANDHSPALAADDPLFGRQHDLDEVLSALDSASLVTITGPGGVGKTSLATAAASATRSRGWRTIWVDLAALSDGAAVSAVVAHALGIDVEVLEKRAAGVVLSDGKQTTVLVIDNAEHLVDAVAPIALWLRDAAPSLRALVTSQVRLKLPHEKVYKLEGLTSPDDAADSASLERFGATALFIARARALDRKFALTSAAAAAIVSICKRLEGVPLAIELAAGRAALFGVEGLERRIDQSLHILGAGFRNVAQRQQTLLGVLDWSYGLLPDAERSLFRRLGAFAGPFTIDWACSLAGVDQEWRIVESLGNLVDRSLVEIVDGEIAAYRLSEAARAFAREKLVESGDRDCLRRAVALYSDEGAAASSNSSELEALKRYSAALELQRSLEQLGDGGERRLQLLLRLGPCIQTALSPSNARCGEVYTEAVALARALNDRAGEYHAVWGCWQFHCMAGRLRDAGPLAHALTEMARALGDDGLELEAWHARFSTDLLAGDASAVIEAAQRAQSIYDPHRHAHLANEFGGHDAGICALGQSSVALWLQGKASASMASADAAVMRAREMSHAYSRAVGFYYAAITYCCLGQTERFTECAKALRATSDEHEMAVLSDEGGMFEGRAIFDAGDRAAGIAQMREVYARLTNAGDVGFGMLYASLYADALIQSQQVVDAAGILEHALSFAGQGQGLFLPELHRLRAAIHANNHERDRAEEELRRSIEIAARQHAHALELRSAIALVRLTQASAVETLAPILARCERALETSDMAAAHALMAEAERRNSMASTLSRRSKVFATILFTDIANSTASLAEKGDAAWRKLLDQHDSMLSQLVRREGGQVVKSTGDGMLAIFDAPGPAIGCALNMQDAMRTLGLAVRAGLHTGEIELRGGDVGGIAVHVAARVMSKADPAEILVSRVVADLLVGSDVRFVDRGETELAGVPGVWRLLAVSSRQ
jgi:predicted ATPase/DNA-binding winged helix-turn-helix (wHTH) protein